MALGGGAGTNRAPAGSRGSGRARRTPRRRRRRTGAAGRFAWVCYRGIELGISAALVAVASLALAMPAMAADRPVWLAGALACAAAGGTGLVVFLERIRARLPGTWRHVANLLGLISLVLLARQFPPLDAVRGLREVVAGERATQDRVVRHQVYAAYRRLDLAAQRRIVERAEVYASTLVRAGAAFEIDPELLAGVASAESSFHPRESRDGGQGLFQITAVPEKAKERARKVLGVRDLDAWNQLHNATIAAATLDVYREQMGGDLFLTLLAYNIGPRNGGLRTIMAQYGARNFAQVQPYLQALPRDYPIRVLSAALAYRLWRRYGELPRFEEPDGARRVQAVGIPGLDGTDSSFVGGPSAARR